MPVANPHNGFIPVIGQKVRVVGACHPGMVGKEAEVVAVYDSEEGKFAEIKYVDEYLGELYTGGLLGGLEPA